MPEKLKPLAVDRIQFELAFVDSDELRNERGISMYLDLSTGDVAWVYHNDEDAEDEVDIPAEENRELRERIAAEPEGFLEIPSLDHSDDHYILQKFLRSSWTDDDALWERTFEAYQGSIGKWRRRVARTTYHAFNAFHAEFGMEMGEMFLRENGIEPKWR